MAKQPDRSNMPVLVLVTGLQGTGKSTAAEEAGALLGAPILGHDWAMSGLRPFPAIQNALDAMEPPGHQAVGWSILLALARAQLRRRSPVILDGVARTPVIARCQQVAAEEFAQLVVVLTECDDSVIHRSRIEGRSRAIPNWYELDWSHVRQSRDRWVRPEHVDLILQSTDPPRTNTERLIELFGE
jgi:predicted kinase